MGMKKLFIILLFIPILSFTQTLNKDNNGYSEVYGVELSKKEIHEKVLLWAGLNYTQKNDGVPTIINSTENRIILEGNIPIDFEFYYKSFEIGIKHTLSISFKENKYKIDFIPKSAYQTNNNSELRDSNFIKRFLREEPLNNNEEFLLIRTNAIKEELLKSGLGYNEKNATRAANRRASKKINDAYARYLNNQENWNLSVSELFKDINDYINSWGDEDW